MPASPVVSTWTVALPVKGWTGALPVKGWTVALPVKGGTAAKTRLGASPELALALAMDCLTAVTDCPVVSRVLVVTSDRAAAAEARERGARVIPERHPGAGLLSACTDAMAEAAHRPGPFALLLADLPALRPADLAVALRAAGRALHRHPGARMAAVPDADGIGTVLLAGRLPTDLDPAFGPSSAAEHVRRGAVRLDLELPRLRHDVDTRADLGVALGLGCGPRTLEALRAYPEHVQATVQQFSPETGAGSVVGDDGLVIPFAAEAFATSGLQQLRPGQRLGVTVTGEGAGAEVTSMWLESVAFVPTLSDQPGADRSARPLRS